jgi:tyrosyl-tRNA synthetase
VLNTRADKRSVCACFAGDLKGSVSRALNQILQPVRDHFENNAEAKDLLKKVCVCV